MKPSVIVLFSLMASAGSVSACPPPRTPPPPFTETIAEEFQLANTVFEATVVGYKDTTQYDKGIAGTLYTAVKPIQGYKGQAKDFPREFRVEMAGHTCDQWPNYQIGSRLLVMTVKGQERPLRVVSADWGTEFQESMAVVRQLSPTTKP